MLDTFDELNWLAIIVATVAWFLFGAIWYARPVLGKAWMRAANIELPEGYRPSPAIFVWTFLAYFVAVVATAILVSATATADIDEAIVLGLVVGIGYLVTSYVIAATYEQRSWALVGINGVYNSLALVGVAILLALWD